jgi:uncharacterized integral membrane protein (TIGR00698 family)
MRIGELKDVAREGIAGIGVALAIAVASRLLQRQVAQADALVVAVVLGMIVRRALGDRTDVFFKLLPGLATAEAIFLPIGVALYGKNLEIAAMLHTHAGTLAQTAIVVAATFAAVLGLGRIPWFGLSQRMLFCLGFGSAVCGASAIAITTPVTECEPDETATALVDNTIAVTVALAFVGVVMRAALGPMQFAAFAGETLHQTSFVRRAVDGMDPEVIKFAMAVKAFRIALLLVSLPIAARVLRRKQAMVPWYLVAFFLVGILFWLVPFGPVVRATVGEIQAVALPAALATVGLRADIGVVGGRLVKPLLLVLLVFALDVGVFYVTRGLTVAG